MKFQSIPRLAPSENKKGLFPKDTGLRRIVADGLCPSGKVSLATLWLPAAPGGRLATTLP